MRKLLYAAALVGAIMLARHATAQVTMEAALLPPDAPSATIESRPPSPTDSHPNDAKAAQPRLVEDGSRPFVPATFLVKQPVTSRNCAAGVVDARACRVHWKPLLRQSFLFLLAQQAGNVAMTPYIRQEMADAHGSWFHNWMTSVSRVHLSHWNDGDPFLTNYIGHPMMGAVTDDLFIQNDPRGRDLTFSDGRAYWMSRLRALGFSAAYHVQWKIGPLSESSIGYEGKDRYISPSSHGWTNGTGAVDWVMTPVAGTAWSVGEDLIDRQIIWRLEGRTNNRLALLGMSVLNPNRSVANLLRGKAPWYRDYRSTRVPTRELPFRMPK